MVYKDILTNKSKVSFTNAVSHYFELIAEQGLNRVFVHVRPFGDALYRSDYFPSSYLVTGCEGGNLSFDPFEIMTKKARDFKLNIEAWINPFRVRSIYVETGTISPKNPVHDFLISGDAIEYGGNIVYNPASQRAWDLIGRGLSEICQRYDIDGIHFDDYFYPTSDPYFDMNSYASYKAAGGGLPQAIWRRNNISMFLKHCWNQVHSFNKNIDFGVSPKGDMNCNLNEEFFDAAEVLSKPGYLDYICPQAYFALNDEVYSFSDCMQVFDSINKIKVKLIAGLPAYKIGHPEPHAGAGEKDWLCGERVLADMVECGKMFSTYSGYSLYSYTSVFEPQPELANRMIIERKALKAIS